MKIPVKHIIITLLVSGVFFSCSKFDEINTDPIRPPEATTDQLLLSAEKHAMDILCNTIVSNRVGMHYAQYWSATGKEENSRYILDENSNIHLWSLYSRPIKDLKEIVRLNENSSVPDPVPNQNAIAGILEAWMFHILTDTYGNVPYSQAANDDILTPVYDDAETIYLDLINKLNQHQQVLDSAAGSFTQGDAIYQGDPIKWKKLANSLILRIAMRMVEVKPAEAKAAIETAVSNGVITSAEEDALFPYTSQAPNQNPYNDAIRALVEFVLSETMVDYMASLNDPRLSMYARPAANSRTIIGKPYGVATEASGDAQKYSIPGTKVYGPDFPGIVMTAAEVNFLLAEATERGMNTRGSAESFYQTAIHTSMDFWDVPASATAEYIQSVPYNSGNWKNVIGTQKWIALYMQGLQAWFERLRLNFTKPDGSALFVGPIAGSLDPSVRFLPNRLTYPVIETNTNGKNKNAAAETIGGDTKGTELWWQKF